MKGEIIGEGESFAIDKKNRNVSLKLTIHREILKRLFWGLGDDKKCHFNFKRIGQKKGKKITYALLIECNEAFPPSDYEVKQTTTGDVLIPKHSKMGWQEINDSAEYQRLMDKIKEVKISGDLKLAEITLKKVVLYNKRCEKKAKSRSQV